MLVLICARHSRLIFDENDLILKKKFSGLNVSTRKTEKNGGWTPIPPIIRREPPFSADFFLYFQAYQTQLWWYWSNFLIYYQDWMCLHRKLKNGSWTAENRHFPSIFFCISRWIRQFGIKFSFINAYLKFVLLLCF